MFDPAALGTTIIGLEAIRQDDHRHPAGTRSVRAESRLSRTRTRLAATLRWTAARIEPSGLQAR